MVSSGSGRGPKVGKRGYRIASGAPPEWSDLCLLCGTAAAGVSHMVGGCPVFDAFYISRHNGAGLLTLEALARGSPRRRGKGRHT